MNRACEHHKNTENCMKKINQVGKNKNVNQ